MLTVSWDWARRENRSPWQGRLVSDSKMFLKQHHQCGPKTTTSYPDWGIAPISLCGWFTKCKLNVRAGSLSVFLPRKHRVIPSMSSVKKEQQKRLKENPLKFAPLCHPAWEDVVDKEKIANHSRKTHQQDLWNYTARCYLLLGQGKAAGKGQEHCWATSVMNSMPKTLVYEGNIWRNWKLSSLKQQVTYNPPLLCCCPGTIGIHCGSTRTLSTFGSSFVMTEENSKDSSQTLMCFISSQMCRWGESLGNEFCCHGFFNITQGLKIL